MGGRNSRIGLVLALYLLFSSFLFQICLADDAMKRGQSIKDGETLISSYETFALGFFSPGNSKKRYVGIWFNRILVQTVVWVANRENPVSDSSGVLRFEDNGNLVVLDGRNTTLWSTNLPAFADLNSTAKLLDSGNLVLLQGKNDESSENFLWESFNHPSDTFLPGMKFGINLRTRESQLLTSWRNPNDPAAGNFSLGFDPDGTAQIMIWEGSKPFWRSGHWNGQGFVGIPEMTSSFLYGFTIIKDKQAGIMYCTYTNNDKFKISRFTLDRSGQLQRSYWLQGRSDWDFVWGQPKNECEIYDFCGFNGNCNRDRSPPCSCFPGFKPRSPKDWASGNWTDGCLRRNQLQCGKNSRRNGSSDGKGDGFLAMVGTKLPDHSSWVAVETTKDCENMCFENCSCVAYAYESGLGCLTWSGDLADVQQFPSGGLELRIRLAPSELGAGKKKRISAIVIVLIVLVTIVLVIYVYFLGRRISKKRERWMEKHAQELIAMDLDARLEAFTDHLDANRLKESVNHRKDLELPIFDFGTVVAATNNFSSANKLGEGGFGPVYKGKLLEGQQIAVKRLSKGSGQGLVEFDNEVVLIAKLQHRNLVRLLGCCSQGDENLLIYEYMPNKSLDAFLFDWEKRELLDWRMRFHIIEGIARGLLYLHRDSRLTIIHRDLKASNILLDEGMNPKISDFGMARIFGGNQEQANTNRVVGTYGYMAPEYAMEGLFSEKSDVYSFGVLLLEIISGKKNTSFYSYGHSLNLLGYAWELWKEDKALDLLDPSLKDSFRKTEVFRCINVGLLCVQEGVEDRPTMSSIVFMLGTEIATLPIPKQPAFSIGRSARETTENSFKSCSINDLSFSTIEAR